MHILVYKARSLMTRLWTIRSSCSVCITESLTKLDTEQKAHSSNYTGGEKAGQSWTDKVMGVKQTSDPPSRLRQDQVEGVDEDEWVGPKQQIVQCHVYPNQFYAYIIITS